ncbi:type I-E CRISPR-associated protein Cse2/CasB [Corynebacterium pilosum]|uniref:type I-E CRISPR-associated protein Cse2/CasB n=1 Tax=Corynebacterium pilosum TaxID=35756 RepID=UPI0004772404|nr:type I-E CRISPR-associated protein Cse2/CasB [Corynebacterium pilosum]
MRATCQALQSDYLSAAGSTRSTSSRATLARLRKAGSGSLLTDPLLLQEVLMILMPELSERELGKGDKPSSSEYAAATAMTLFAIHMQSATQPAHNPMQSFAYACGILNSLELSNSIKPRVDAMLLATNEAARIVHIRSLVTLMRGNNINFDYGRFADDLRRLADAKKRSGVQLRWGRDFVYGTRSHFSNSNPQS